MENKQTAVEWLAKKLEGYGNPSACEIAWEDFDSLIERAKQMEKEQIIKAANDADDSDFWVKYESFEQYYNETYGK